MNVPQSDSENFYIAALKARDEVVFKKIYDLYWSRLYISAYNVLRDKQQSEDVVQEVFSNLWKQGEKLDIKNLSAWLYTSVRYQVFNLLRSGKVRQKYEHSPAHELVIENIAEVKLDNEDIRLRLEASIEELPPRCKTIFMMSRFEYLSHKEIAEKLGVSEKTVENQITIALKKLRISLSDLVFILPFILFK